MSTEKYYNKADLMKTMKVGHEFMDFLIQKFNIQTIAIKTASNKTCQYYTQYTVDNMLEILKFNRKNLKDEFRQRNTNEVSDEEDTPSQFSDAELDAFEYNPHPAITIKYLHDLTFEVLLQETPESDIERHCLNKQRLIDFIKKYIENNGTI